jgi:poly(3-hydroxybutyrate) depolymerase
MKFQQKNLFSALAVLATTGLLGLACSDESTAPGPVGGATSTGGSSSPATGGTTGGSGTGGTKASTGGASPSSGGSTPAGGTSNGGSGGSGGQPGAGRGGGGAGGGMNGGGAGKSAGTAGVSGGGAGGAVGGNAGAGGKDNGGGAGGGAGAGAGGGSTKASAGCSKGAARPASGSVSTASYYLTFPESYDGKAPVPVLIGFHGCGSVNRGTDLASTEYVRQTRGTPFETEYVVAVPISKSTGGCWTYNDDMPRIKAMYDDMVANYCVDQNHVFATGHSSGADLIGQIQNTNHTADAQYIGFKGVAPVAGALQTIAAPIAVMYIQGTMDAERNNSDGENVVQRFTSANMCMSTYAAYPEVMGCKSKFDQADVDPGCRLYDGCTAKTVWCRHNDKDYSGTMHGIPCFAMKSMHDFFQSLP